MAKKIYFISVLFFLILFNSVSGLNISSCQTISAADTTYDLTGAISSSGACTTY